MTVCRFYAYGYCRYGNSCRFEHIDNTRNHYQKTYERNDGHRSQPSSTPKVDFSFNRTLQTIANTNRTAVQPSALFGGGSAIPQNVAQISSFNRTHQLSKPISSHPTQSSSIGFSFNRTLQQLPSSSDRQSTHDIEMDANSNVSQSVQTSMNFREPRPHPFRFASQPNVGLFGNKQPESHKHETIQNSVTSSSIMIKVNDEIYSKTSDLMENDIKSYKSDAFMYKSIPIRPPPQELCI